jgi:hypothetical protein
MIKETVDKKPKMLRIERTRTHYARSHGDSTRVRVDEPLAVDLELPTSYAQDLRASLCRSLSEGYDFDQALIAVDVPMRLYLRPLQVEQLVERLAEVTE